MDRNRVTDDQLLYHYTDYTALDGIVNKRELRVNNELNMNDAAEMDIFVSGICTAVEKRFSPEEDAEFLERTHLVLEDLRKHYFDFSVYAACFSGYRDDASQWERYANRGKGVCLCFRRSVLEKMTGGPLSLLKVFYQSNLESHPLVDSLYNAIKNSTKLEDVVASPETLEESWRNCASFKHPSFLSENETRLILIPFIVPDFELTPHYHVAKERIKKYYPLNLDTMCLNAGASLEDLIIEIMIGPESTQSEPILRDYLRDLGLNTLAKHISQSDCPLRSRM